MKIHCPKCKSFNLIPSTENAVGGAITTTTGNLSVTTVSNDHKNYWICRDCGTKFKNLSSLDEEIAKAKRNTVGYCITSIVGTVLVLAALIFLNSMDFAFIIAPICATPFVCAVVFCIAFVTEKLKIKKLITEKSYLEINCFD